MAKLGRGGLPSGSHAEQSTRPTCWPTTAFRRPLASARINDGIACRGWVYFLYCTVLQVGNSPGMYFLLFPSSLLVSLLSGTRYLAYPFMSVLRTCLAIVGISAQVGTEGASEPRISISLTTLLPLKSLSITDTPRL